jgi:hypothetical protein
MAEAFVDRELDRVVDTQNVSYFEARRILGYEQETPDASAQLAAVSVQVPRTAAPSRPRQTRMSSAQRSHRALVAQGAQLGEEAGVGYEDGLPPEWQRHVVLSPEQVAINTRGAAEARAAVAQHLAAIVLACG